MPTSDAERIERSSHNLISTVLTVAGTFLVTGIVYVISSFIFDDATMGYSGRAAPRIAMWFMVGVAIVGVLFGLIGGALAKPRRTNFLVLGFGSALFAASIAGGLWFVTGPIFDIEQSVNERLSAPD